VVEEVEMTHESVWTGVPDGTEPAEREEFEIKILPEEPDVVMTADEVDRRQLDAVREVALAYFLNTAAGVQLPLPDLRSWPERYRKAFDDELERLRGRRFER
jgi:hypothetical protein